VQIFKNGTVYAINESVGAAYPGASSAHLASTLMPCVVGDTIDVRVYQNTGANLNVVGDDARTFFQVAFVSQ
jgi:hypothetical protein